MDTCADEVPGGIFKDQFIGGVNDAKKRTINFNKSLIGSKSNRTRVQCSLDCITHDSCVAVSWRAQMDEEQEPLREGTCFLFRQVTSYPSCENQSIPGISIGTARGGHL